MHCELLLPRIHRFFGTRGHGASPSLRPPYLQLAASFVILSLLLRPASSSSSSSSSSSPWLFVMRPTMLMQLHPKQGRRTEASSQSSSRTGAAQEAQSVRAGIAVAETGAEVATALETRWVDAEVEVDLRSSLIIAVLVAALAQAQPQTVASLSRNSSGSRAATSLLCIKQLLHVSSCCRTKRALLQVSQFCPCWCYSFGCDCRFCPGRRAKQWTSTRQSEAQGRRSSRDLEVDVDVRHRLVDGTRSLDRRRRRRRGRRCSRGTPA